MDLSQKVFQLGAFIKHWLLQVNAHSLQNPFLYTFYSSVVLGKGMPEPKIENLRRDLLNTKESIEIKELGAGSTLTKSPTRKIADIARYSTTPAHFSGFLQRLANYLQTDNILELGTSLGLNTAYLANTGCKVYTFEGCPNTAQFATNNLAVLGYHNTTIIEGNIDVTLPDFLKNTSLKFGLVYLDANHRYEPTLRYVNYILPHLTSNAVLVLDDIHWSRPMHKAWQELRQDARFSIKLDMFEAGLLFVNPNYQPADFAIAY